MFPKEKKKCSQRYKKKESKKDASQTLFGIQRVPSVHTIKEYSQSKIFNVEEIKEERNQSYHLQESSGCH